jgi:hypothetical protein
MAFLGIATDIVAPTHQQSRHWAQDRFNVIDAQDALALSQQYPRLVRRRLS